MVSVTGVDPGALRDAQMLVNIVNLISEPDRRTLVAQLQQLADAVKAHNAALAEIGKREAAVLHREQQATKHEETLRQRLTDVAERERRATAAMQHIEEKRAELEQFRNEMQGWTKAAA
jgi:hypothetical protein